MGEATMWRDSLFRNPSSPLLVGFVRRAGSKTKTDTAAHYRKEDEYARSETFSYQNGFQRILRR